MKIEINPRTLLHLEQICEVLHKLHPYVLDYLLDMQRSLGNILGFIDLNNPSVEEREFISNNYSEKDYSEPDTSKVEEDSSEPDNSKVEEDSSEPDNSKVEEDSSEPDTSSKVKSSTIDQIMKLCCKLKYLKEDEQVFYELKRYLKLDSYEYIPIKIFIEVEDPVMGRKVSELVRALELTRAIEQFIYNKREIDEDAYFSEGYGLAMNSDQRKQMDDFFENKDVTNLRKLLKEKKLY